MGGPPEPPTGGGAVPETFNKDDMNLLLEETLFRGSDYMDLARGRNYLVEIDEKLKKLIDK
jgi:hypothetical protein